MHLLSWMLCEAEVITTYEALAWSSIYTAALVCACVAQELEIDVFCAFSV